jgi:hypothetical protein
MSQSMGGDGMKRWEWLNVYIHKQATSQGFGGSMLGNLGG